MPTKREKPAPDDDMRPPAEAAQLTRSVMKAMTEMAPEPHEKVSRRAKGERKKAAKRRSKR